MNPRPLSSGCSWLPPSYLSGCVYKAKIKISFKCQPSKAKSSSPSPLCGGLFLLHFLCSPYRHLLGVWEQILLLSPPDPTRRRWEASLPVLAYSGEKAWGQGQRQADTNSVTASLVSHSAEAAGRSASPPDGLVSHHRSQRLLWSQPSSGRCSGSYGFTGLSSLSRVTTLLWKRSPRGDPKQDRKSSAFPGTPPPPPALQTLHWGLKWPGQAKRSARLLFCPFCETHELAIPQDKYNFLCKRGDFLHCSSLTWWLRQ